MATARPPLPASRRPSGYDLPTYNDIPAGGDPRGAQPFTKSVPKPEITKVGEQPFAIDPYTATGRQVSGVTA